MSLNRLTAVAIAVMIILSGMVLAEVPQVMSFQGRLTDDTGAPLPDGAKSVRFIIWNDPTSTLPANEVWNSGPVTVSTVDGLFSVNLGEPPMAVLPPDVAKDTNLWMGITVGAEPEGMPRMKITSSAFALRAHYADTAGYAFGYAGGDIDHGTLMGLGDDDHPQYFRADGSRTMSGSMDAGFFPIRNLAQGTLSSDAVRCDQAVKHGDAASGDLTGTYPSPEIGMGTVGSSEIANYAIADIDISGSAAIGVSKISGTALNLTSSQTVTGSKTFTGNFYVGDSTIWANNYGVNIGTRLSIPTSTIPLRVSREFSTSQTAYGIAAIAENNGSGSVYASYTRARTNSSGDIYGSYIEGDASTTSHAGFRTGIKVLAGRYENVSGESYGIQAYGYGGTEAYGVYGVAMYGDVNYAGYFYGNLRTNATLSKAAGSFRIDHPLDPENKYLQHSFVESPDMMNIYNGIVTTDGNGLAVVILPSYFEALNRDFRYQLTVIGEFAQAIIAEEISGGKFTIRTDKPNVKVSWMVTGIRHDPYAEANRIEVEVEKSVKERGYYQNPEVYGLGVEHSVDREKILEAQREAMEEGLE